MKTKLFLLSCLSIFFLFFQSTMIYSQKKSKEPEPELIWEYKAPKKTYLIPEFDQPEEGREFYLYKYEEIKLNKKVDFLIMDVQTGKIKREYELKTIEDKFDLYQVYWKNDYFIKRYYGGRLDVYKFDTMKLLCSIKFNSEDTPIINFDLLTEKKILIINKIVNIKYNILTFHNLETGREIFSIKYEHSESPSNDTKYYIIYEKPDTIAILEKSILDNGKDFSMYSLLDGSLKGKVEGDFSKTFNSEKEEEIYIVTYKPICLKKVNIKTGKLLSEIKLKITGYISTLTEIDGLVYLTYQNDSVKNSNGLACIDTMKNEVIWNKLLPITSSINLINQEDDIVTFDNKTVYRLNKKTGSEVWSLKLMNSKVIRKEKEGLMVGLGFGGTSKLYEDIGYSGFVLLNEKTGEIKWQFNVKKGECISNLIYNIDDENVYFADTKNFYILNPKNGELILEKKIDLENEIFSSLYVKEKNQMLFITKNSFVLYDIKTEKVVYETAIIGAAKYFVYEAKLIGNYLIFTGIGPEPVIRTLLNVNTGKIIWSNQIGINHWEAATSVGIYMINGTYSSRSDDYNYSTFWPRRDIFEENIFVLCKPNLPDKNSDLKDMDFILKAYKIFPEETKPSSAEIKKTVTIFGVNNKLSSSSYIKSLLSKINYLWEKE